MTLNAEVITYGGAKQEPGVIGQKYNSYDSNGVKTLVAAEAGKQIQVTKFNVDFEDEAGAVSTGTCVFEFRSSVVANVNDILHVSLRDATHYGEQAPDDKCLFACNVGEPLCMNLRCSVAPFEATVYIQYRLRTQG